jgi:hypothetical protein
MDEFIIAEIGARVNFYVVTGQFIAMSNGMRRLSSDASNFCTA